MPGMPARLTVEEFTTPNPLTAAEDAGIDELRRLMQQHGIRHVPIVRGPAVVGLVSDRDLKVVAALEPERQSQLVAADLMAADPVSVQLDDPLHQVALRMSEQKIGSVIVLDQEGAFYGIFTATDALNALIEVLRGEV